VWGADKIEEYRILFLSVNLGRFLREFGQLFSSELGIDLSNEFEWLIASILFGNRISTEIAKRTFFAYRRAGLTTPWRIAQASWQDLVRVHGEGGYVRYDGITATYMKETAAKVIREYGGDLSQLDRVSRDPRDLERRLMEFKGVGLVTARIFLRDLRGRWKNADPEPTDVELIAARALGIVAHEERALDELKAFWERNKVPGYSLSNLQSALVRLGVRLRRGRRIQDIAPYLATP